MDLVNFPCPGSPMLDDMDWDWVCETGMAGGDNDIQLDGSTSLTELDGSTTCFNVYGIYDRSVKLHDVVANSGVEYYFVPLNVDAWAQNDINESGRYALKLRQSPCYSQSGMSAEISKVSREFDIHCISLYKPGAADTTMDAMSNDVLLNSFMDRQTKPEYVIQEVLKSYETQQEAWRLEAAPPVGEPALLTMMAPVYFHCTSKKDGTPSVQCRWVKAVWYGYETCIAETDDTSDLFWDTDWAIDMAHEAWWDVCNYGLIPFIRDLELTAEEAKSLFEEEDFVHGDVVITRDEINQDLFNLCDEHCQDLPDPAFRDEVMACFTEAAEKLLDNMCDIVAQGGDLKDHADRDLYCNCELEAWDCYNAFINVNDDVEELRSRLYSVGAGADLHQGNVAYWNGDLVCIDFGACSST